MERWKWEDAWENDECGMGMGIAIIGKVCEDGARQWVKGKEWIDIDIDIDLY